MWGESWRLKTGLLFTSARSGDFTKSMTCTGEMISNAWIPRWRVGVQKEKRCERPTFEVASGICCFAGRRHVCRFVRYGRRCVAGRLEPARFPAPVSRCGKCWEAGRKWLQPGLSRSWRMAVYSAPLHGSTPLLIVQILFSAEAALTAAF